MHFSKRFKQVKHEVIAPGNFVSLTWIFSEHHPCKQKLLLNIFFETSVFVFVQCSYEPHMCYEPSYFPFGYFCVYLLLKFAKTRMNFSYWLYKYFHLLIGNDLKHTSRPVKYWLSLQNNDVLDQSPYTLDLNPIEKLWETVKQHLKNKNPRNSDELFQFVQQSWENISLRTCQSFIKI